MSRFLRVLGGIEVMETFFKKVLKYSLIILILPLLGFVAYFTDIIFFEVLGNFYSIPGQYISLAILYPSGITNHYLNLGLTTFIVLTSYYCFGICLFTGIFALKYTINRLLMTIFGKDYISERRKKELKSQFVALIVTMAIGYYFLIIILNFPYTSNYSEIYNLEVDKDKIDTLNEDGLGPLHLAAQYGNVDIVNKLIENGADINIKDKYGSTALRWAIVGDNKDIALLLIKKGIDFKIKDESGHTALDIAVRKNKYDIAHILINKGADIDNRNDKGYTPLHAAILFNHYKIAELLIENGADVNSQGKCGYYPAGRYDDIKKCEGYTGWSPLHSAASIGNAKMIELLLKNRANANIKDFDGNTPTDIAIKNGNKKARKFLEEWTQGNRNNAD